MVSMTVMRIVGQHQVRAPGKSAAPLIHQQKQPLDAGPMATSESGSRRNAGTAAGAASRSRNGGRQALAGSVITNLATGSQMLAMRSGGRSAAQRQRP